MKHTFKQCRADCPGCALCDDDLTPQAREETAQRSRDFVTRVVYGLQCPYCEKPQTEVIRSQHYFCHWCGHTWGFEHGEKYGF